MPSTLPSPVAAAIGVVPAVLDGVRKIPGKAVQLPILALSHALSAVESLRREYDDLADRGERLVGRLRGTAGDLADDVSDRAGSLEDRIEDARAPFATAYDRAEDALEGAASTLQQLPAQVVGFAAVTVETAADTVQDAADALAGGTSSVVDRAAGAVADTAETVADSAETVAGTAETVDDTAETGANPAETAPKGVATPKAVEPDATRVDTAAAPSVVAVVEQAVAAAPAVTPDHDALPLPDYDHMTLGSLRGRLRSLPVEQLVQIRAYEKAHADRLPVVTMLDNRIAKLSMAGPAPTAG